MRDDIPEQNRRFGSIIHDLRQVLPRRTRITEQDTADFQALCKNETGNDINRERGAVYAERLGG